VARKNPVSGLATVTSAPATTAPLESVTVPWMPPRKVWPNKVADRQNKRTKEKNPEERVLIATDLELRLAGGRIIPLESKCSPRRRGDAETRRTAKPKSFTTEDAEEHRG